MKDWKDITHYAGFDWAKDHHLVVIVDGQGQIVADFEFEHSLEGWKSFSQKTAPWPNLGVAIETNQGAAVDQLLQRDYTVYPINPTASESYRKRKAQKPITWMVGLWPMRYESKARAGSRLSRWIH